MLGVVQSLVTIGEELRGILAACACRCTPVMGVAYSLSEHHASSAMATTFLLSEAFCAPGAHRAFCASQEFYLCPAVAAQGCKEGGCGGLFRASPHLLHWQSRWAQPGL